MLNNNSSQLRAVFRVTPGELYEIVTYGRVLRKNRDPMFRRICEALGTYNIIIGAGYIDRPGASSIAKELVPLGSSDSLWITVKLDKAHKYLAVPSRILKDQEPSAATVLIKGWEQAYFPDAPDTAVVMGQIDESKILSIETTKPSAVRALASVHPSIPWWERLKRGM